MVARSIFPPPKTLVEANVSLHLHAKFESCLWMFSAVCCVLHSICLQLSQRLQHVLFCATNDCSLLACRMGYSRESHSWRTPLAMQSVEHCRRQHGLQPRDEAVAERIMAGLEKLQARLDEINTKLDGTKKGVSDRRDMMLRRRSSSKSRREQQGS